MQKTGLGFNEASDLLYGGAGSNVDLRNWDAIMASSNPAAAARSGLQQMYTGDYNTSTRPDSVQQYSNRSGNIGIGTGPRQDVYLLDNQGNALTQIGSKGSVYGDRAGSVFGLDITGDMAKLGLKGNPGAVGATLEGNWLDPTGAMERYKNSLNGPQAESYGSAAGGSMSPQLASLTAYQKNPYLDEMAGDITSQINNNLQRNILPNIRAESIAAGGYGDSRNAITDALAVGETNRNLSGALSNLYGTDYNNQMNRNLQQYGIDNQTNLGWAANALGNKQADMSFNLGQGNLGLGYANLDRNINNDNKSWQLQGANFGLGIYDRLQQGNQLALGAGTQIQNTPMDYWSRFSNAANSMGNGYGTSTSSSGGNTLMGAMGGAQIGSRIGNWWGSQSPNAAGGANSQGWGTGAGYGNQDFGSYF